MIRTRTTRARRLRRNMTEAEKRLWVAIREALADIRFRRQHPIGRYIVDFACPAAKLVIELDGGHHALSSAADEIRSRELVRRGYRVIRFWNGDVMENLAGVLEVIREEIEISLSALGGRRGSG